MKKTWFVTGAGRGLGRCISEAVLEAGDNLVGGVRNPSQLADLQRRYGERIKSVSLDVSVKASADAAVAEAVSTFGRLDVLVNNAGYGHVASFEDCSEADFRQQIETNFFGAVHTTRAAIPVMREQRGGCIFQISSVGGRTSTPGLSAYQAAKWAVGGVSDVIAKEVAPFGIVVCTLEPGGMRTGWAAEARNSNRSVSPEYEPTVGKILDMLQLYGGKEVSDPKKIASKILGLSERTDLPSRLLLGADAIYICEQEETRRRKDAAKWKDLSMSTHADDAALPAGLDSLQ